MIDVMTCLKLEKWGWRRQGYYEKASSASFFQWNCYSCRYGCLGTLKPNIFLTTWFFLKPNFNSHFSLFLWVLLFFFFFVHFLGLSLHNFPEGMAVFFGSLKVPMNLLMCINNVLNQIGLIIQISTSLTLQLCFAALFKRLVMH